MGEGLPCYGFLAQQRRRSLLKGVSLSPSCDMSSKCQAPHVRCPGHVGDGSAGEVKVVGAVYDITTGKVTVL
jgi:hypothetical protein